MTEGSLTSKTLPDASEREALTLPYLERKRRMVATELGDTLEGVFDYGEHDPLHVPIAPCDTCGVAPHLAKVQDDPVRWQVQCPCGKRHREAHKRPWLAILAWNQINLGTQRYRNFQMFSIAALSPGDARERMIVVRQELELRRKVAGLDRRIKGELGQRPPGKQYRIRLEAYLAWALLAQRLIKAASADE